MSEETEHIALCKYIKRKYPDVIFLSDLSGERRTIGQAMKAKLLRSGKGLPDLLILERRRNYGGLFIELKRTGEVVIATSGISKTDHIQEQLVMIDRLNKKGYYARMCIGLEKAKECVDTYMNF